MRRHLLVLGLGLVATLLVLGVSCSDETATGATPPAAGGAHGGEICVEDGDCTESSHVCVEGLCVPGAVVCLSDADCTDGICVDGVCAARDGEVCAEDSHCDEGEHCAAGHCGTGTTCASNADCPRGESCLDEVCQADQRTPCDGNNDCGAGEVCVDRFCEAGGAVGCLVYAPVVAEDPAAPLTLRGELSFGSSPNIGDVRVVEVTVTNTCQSAVSVLQVGFESTTSAEFSMVTDQTLPFRIDPGVQLGITVTYAPVDFTEERTGQFLAITSNDAHPTAKYELKVEYKGASVFTITEDPAATTPNTANHNFGAVPVGGLGQQRLYLKNTGSGNHLLHISALNIDASGTPFSVSPELGAGDAAIVLAPFHGCVGDPDCAVGQTCDIVSGGLCLNADGSWEGVVAIDVSYMPTQARSDQQRLVVVHDEGAAGSAPTDTTFELLLVGGGGNPPALVVNPEQVDFGDVENDTAVTRDVRLENAGDQVLRVQNLRMRAFSSPEFSFSPPNIPDIPAGGFQILTVRYAPLAPGLGADAGGVELDSNDPARPTAVVELAGNSTDPTAFVFPSSVDFGGVSLNDPPPTRTITVRNAGFGLLEIPAVQLGGGSDPSFSIVNPPAVPFQLPDGTVELTFDVQFMPTVAGIRTGSAEIDTTDFDNPFISVPLTGDGRADCFSYYQDLDFDGYGNPFVSVLGCVAPAGYVGNAGDCNDSRNDVFPGSTERCDGADNDCNGGTADGSGEPWLAQPCDGPDADQCREGNAACVGGVQSCSDATGDSVEICDGVDNDCDGVSDEGVGTTFYQDADLDGFGNAFVSQVACNQPAGYVITSTDCNDARNDVRPGATERCDGVDNDCDASTGDGLGEVWFNQACDGADTDLCPEGQFTCVASVQSCSDVTGNSLEVCDNADNDCDGATDEGVGNIYNRDADADGYGDPANTTQACTQPAGYVLNNTDCNDTRGSQYPGATEACNGVDDDCDPISADGSGEAWLNSACDGADADLCAEGLSVCTVGVRSCTDDAVTRVESCNGVDDNCDGTIDEGVKTTYFRDADGDGYGASASSLEACSLPAGYVLNSTDCNDARNDVHPGATERCDGVDSDCSGATLDGAGEAWVGQACDGPDTDLCPEGTYSCTAGAQLCSDASGNSVEVCNGLDDNCDGTIDEGVKTTYFRDADGDTFGAAATTTQACSAPAGYVASSTDCDDTRANVYPGAAESCDLLDNDCDASVDEGVTTTFYRDVDADGYGNGAISVQACTAPAGHVAAGTDCNDAAAAINPGATESCNSLDDNCDGTVDEGVRTTYYRDADADGYGAVGTTVQACSVPAGYVVNSTDCHDGRNDIYPGATERCDGADNDCNGATPDGSGEAWIGTTCDGLDTDLCREGNNSCTAGLQVCTDLTGNSVETCNGIDDDCDGTIDEGVKTTYYRDADGDGYGAAGVTTEACSQPAGYVAGSTDCDDSRANVRPGATETCDTLDNDCNAGTTDGSGEPWIGQTCDGTDTDVCREGTYSCSGGSQSCSDITGSTVEICNGLDDECDATIDNGGAALCPPPAGTGVTTTSCSGVAGCSVTGCSAGRYNVDGLFPNGCECIDDSNGAACGLATGFGSLAAGQSSTINGKIPVAGQADWFTVSFPSNFDYASHGTGTPTIDFVLNEGDAFRFEVTDVCGGSVLGCGSGGTATGLASWSFTDDASPAGAGAFTTRGTAWPASVTIRVTRTTAGASCANYTLRVTR